MVQPLRETLKAGRSPADPENVMDQRHERVLIETPRHRIAGTLTLARDGYRSRVSDLLNAPERDFISLTDVTIEVLDHDGPGTQHDFLAVSRQHIVFAIPMGEAVPAGEIS
jgi:hypothetical protein